MKGLVTGSACGSPWKMSPTPGLFLSVRLWVNHPPETGRGWAAVWSEIQRVLLKISPRNPWPLVAPGSAESGGDCRRQDAMQPQQLHASEVTPSGFRLAWPPLLTADSGYYVLEVALSAEPGTARREQLPGNATGWAWAGLEPDTDYDVALVPESNLRLVRPQRLRVRTLPGEAGPERIVISHARPRSLRVSWAPALGPAAALGYHVQFGPLRSGAAQRVDVPAGRNSTTLQGLAPGTAYLVTVTAAFRSGRERAMSAKACTPVSERSRAPRPPPPGAGGPEP
nr:von Willebrand factor A domain-containing protein 1 isoform X3 [Manis javanica]